MNYEIPAVPLAIDTIRSSFAGVVARLTSEIIIYFNYFTLIILINRGIIKLIKGA